MDEYTDFGLLENNELTVLRKGFFKPVFEFTDGQFSYGKVITNKGKSTILETSKESWGLQREGSQLKNTLLISNKQAGNIGIVSNGDTFLRLNNGFEATLTITGGSRSVVSGGWKNQQYGDLASFKQSWTSYKKPYIITFDNALLKSVAEMPLLILLGTYIAFLRQTRPLL